jgi:hypothetical protein
MGERRARPRFEIVGGDLWGTLTATTSMTMKDIGAGGVLVESPVPLPAGSSHTVHTTLEGQLQQLQVRVRHCTSAPEREPGSAYVIGLEFMTITAAMKRFIDAHVPRVPGPAGLV